MADESDNEAPQQGAGKKRLIIMIAIAVVLLLSAGAAAYLLLGDDAPAEEQAEQEIERGEPVYHELDPPFVVTLPPGGPAGMLQIAIEVMSRSPDVPATLAANDPMIRHHVLNLL